MGRHGCHQSRPSAKPGSWRVRELVVPGRSPGRQQRLMGSPARRRRAPSTRRVSPPCQAPYWTPLSSLWRPSDGRARLAQLRFRPRGCSGPTDWPGRSAHKSGRSDLSLVRAMRFCLACSISTHLGTAPAVHAGRRLPPLDGTRCANPARTADPRPAVALAGGTGRPQGHEATAAAASYGRHLPESPRRVGLLASPRSSGPSSG